MKFNYAATDSVNTVLRNQSALTEQQEDFNYGPWGDTLAKSGAITPGFNGERRDLVTGVTHLGNGYRAYDPVLLRFQAPDSLSPFGDGGINSYAYCEGDPINRSDPSGHMSWQAGVGIGLSIIGVGLSVVGGYAAISAAKGLAAVTKATAITVATALPGIAAFATGVASATVEDPETAKQLGWASLCLGVVSVIVGGVTAEYGHAMKKASSTKNPNRTGNQLELTERSEHSAPGDAARTEQRRLAGVERRRREATALAEQRRRDPRIQLERDKTTVVDGKIGSYELLDNGRGNIIHPSVFVPYKDNDPRLKRYMNSNRINRPQEPQPLNRRDDPKRHEYNW
jgi:RHS repeat-associated protein